MSKINKSAPILVTGATGYVAGVLIKKLLLAGFTVHAAVRDPNNKQKTQYLDQIAKNSKGTVKYFATDLLIEGAYEQAMLGCELIFHTASPFQLTVSDPQKELLDPAILGTKNILLQANKSKTVKRVVLTSSVAAIYGDNCDLKKVGENGFTEQHWNTTSSLEHQAYAYSKTLAEQQAWEINKQQNKWDLVVINPSLVIGPGINPFATSESFTLIKAIGDGTLKMGVPYWGMGVVDVREVAEAHFAAGFTDTAQGRYIVNAHNTDLFALSQALSDQFAKAYAIPKLLLPKWLVWLLGPFFDKKMTRKMIAKNVNFPWLADNTKSINELNVNYRPLQDSMNDFFQQLVDNNYFK